MDTTISADFSFNAHVRNRCQSITAIVYRVFASRNLQTMRKAFITYLGTLLEFNSIVLGSCMIQLSDGSSWHSNMLNKPHHCALSNQRSNVLTNVHFQNALPRLNCTSVTLYIIIYVYNNNNNNNKTAVNAAYVGTLNDRIAAAVYSPRK